MYYLICLDQFFKHWFSIYRINTGVMYNMFDLEYTNSIITIISILLFILYKNTFKKELYLEVFFSGVLSNTIDRILYGGVIDILYLPYIYWFNLSDIYICFFSILLYLYSRYKIKNRRVI